MTPICMRLMPWSFCR